MSNNEVVERGGGPFDLLVWLGGAMGAITALLTALNGVIEAIDTARFQRLLPMLAWLVPVIVLMGGISVLTWLVRRAKNPIVNVIVVAALTLIINVLAVAMAGAVLPKLGLQLVIQPIPREAPAVASATNVEPIAAPEADRQAPGGALPQAPADTPEPAAGAVAPPPPVATAEAPASGFEACAAAASAAAADSAELEEALVRCIGL